MKQIQSFLFTLLILVFLSSGLLAENLQQPYQIEPDIYNFDIQMNSFILEPKNSPYNLQIDLSYLPGTENLKNLPVIYVTDGQWRRMEHKYIHYLSYKKIIPPMIVVGIGYPEVYVADQVRIIDLMLRPKNFLETIRQEIIPIVEKKFNTNPENRILFGASSGGHFITYAFLATSLADNSPFKSYIGSSPYLPRTQVIEMATELASKERDIPVNLYLAYGENESISDYHIPNNMLFEILETIKSKNFRFNYHVYPQADHYTNTRLALIDGLRLFLGNESTKGIGAVDLEYKTFYYDFKTNTQFYDWKTNFFADYSFSTDKNYSLSPNSGSVKVNADFTKYSSLRFETSSVFFENLADRELEFSIYIPQDLAKLNYELKFHIYSTFDMPWITDTSDSFPLNKSGWNTFKYKWRDKEISGNMDCIRGFGVTIEKNPSTPAWKGSLYFDDIRW